MYHEYQANVLPLRKWYRNHVCHWIYYFPMEAHRKPKAINH